MNKLTYIKNKLPPIRLNNYNKFINSYNYLNESTGGYYNINYDKCKITIDYDNKYHNKLYDPYDPFLINMIVDISNYIRKKTNINTINMNIYQNREIINKDKTIIPNNNKSSDYVIPTIILNNYNTESGHEYVLYTKNKRRLDQFRMNNNEYILMNNRDIYHKEVPVKFISRDNIFSNIGYRDILKIYINIT